MHRNCTYGSFYGKLLFAFVLIVRKNQYALPSVFGKVNTNIPLCHRLVIYLSFFNCLDMYSSVHLSLFMLFENRSSDVP